MNLILQVQSYLTNIIWNHRCIQAVDLALPTFSVSLIVDMKNFSEKINIENIPVNVMVEKVQLV